MNLLLFGPPGAGKGTQSSLLVKNKGMNHISTGDLFRSAIKNQTELGQKAKAFMDKGELVPDEVVIGMVEEAFLNNKGEDVILDGFPRTVPQAEALEGLLKKNGLQVDKAVFLEVPENVVVERMSGRRVCKNCGAVYHASHQPPQKDGVCDECGGEVVQRDDDREEAIRKRLSVYAETTAPLKSFYGDRGSLAEVDGTGSSEEVHQRLSEALN